MDRPRILLADDHAGFAALVARLVETEFEIVQTFADGQAIVDGARTVVADVLLLDITMPGMSGIEAARQLRNADGAAKVSACFDTPSGMGPEGRVPTTLGELVSLT